MPGDPGAEVIAAFGCEPAGLTTRLPGGQGRAFRRGDLFLKPVDDPAEASWCAETLVAIEQDGFRVPRPIRAVHGGWVESGWTAWEWIAGQPAGRNGGRWPETLAACRAFHAALRDVPRPAFLGARRDPWADADRIAWAEAELDAPTEIGALLARLTDGLGPVDLPAQVIHGDFTANVLFEPGLPPAVIDFSPYWRPPGFALAIVVVDALTWGGADARMLDFVREEPRIEQLLLRAELRRLVEVELHDRATGRLRPDEVRAHEPTIDVLRSLAAH